MTKPRLTFEEHTDLGIRLAAIRDELLHLCTTLTNAYPRSGPEARAGKEVNTAREALDQARKHLENMLYNEHPRQAETTVYYPHPEDRHVSLGPWE
ncbi:hypothetical protein ACFTXJ_14390 [Streptomyces zhihengii]|uniref:hypothetical protein n=1 Tax=Streptomyces zhihengii TaxID=1818004 RepID=UPI0036267065